ncbi:NAD-dependent epimerase/dehydratase family protein [bacterium]|nr:NAD-dependent epimerase/dehydratase family protein [bacterium]
MEKNTNLENDDRFFRCLVIGGSGMLGYEIALQLFNEGKEVRILDLVSANDSRFEEHIGDIRNPEDVKKACKDVDIVFQTAAAVWNPRTPEHVYEEVNVKGNQLVIDTCKELGIGKLVFTSSMDVVVDGRKPIVDGDESLPYPANEPKDPYSRTKIIAEKMVLQANDNTLLTCSIRPAGIYGPRDKYHLPNLIKAAQNKSNFRLGNGLAKFSHVYSENAAYAHILAAKHLAYGSPVAGNFYFITDHHPAANLFDFMEPFLIGLGLNPPKKSIPYPVAYFLSMINEKFNPYSNFNRFSVIQTCVDHTFVHYKATADFGYKPIVSKEEAFKRTLEWFKNYSGFF